MKMSLSDAKGKLTNLENQLKQLKKELRQIQAATKKGDKGQIKKQIKKIENTLPGLRKYIYEKSKNSIKDSGLERQRALLVKQQEEVMRTRLIQQDMKLREQKKPFLLNRDFNDKSKKVCPSCGVPFNNSYGLSRCRCN
ncbi:hypothetical protein RCG23_03530 [Neobacillus sp. PS3-34]|uniref:hypothetical protein n=1 Tax=Neobacillus sp. PS3-34 TaxID=3070678 RepID=UPI0027DFAD83|nr:hypothetical protein [Neobacillus sp. PS3-34]WML49175.1 hypothetical protein RCG23_03530 [Neobacillus sp. PS3-34]